MATPEVNTQRIDVVVNGEAKKVAPCLTVDRLLQFLDIPLDRVAVELNRSIVSKRDWPSTAVEPGARLEIVQFVGGG